MFQTTNMELARDFWIIIASGLGAVAILRIVTLYQTHSRLRRRATGTVKHPTTPSNPLQQAFATATAIFREMTYPQLFIRARGLSWLSPPPLGRSLVLLVYFAIITYMMAAGTNIMDGYFWERIGFRNAWIATAQVPLVYLLASKYSVLGLVVGAGHERLNWLHRWVSRTLLVTATVHGFYFFEEWVLADLVETQLSMMPMIRYGFAAWGVLALQAVISAGPLRALCYEAFVAQHAISAVVFLYLLYVHVPAYARPAIWVSVAALASDRLGRTALLVRNNLRMGGSGRRVGHLARVRAVGPRTTVVAVDDVRFAWRAGQHVYLWLPGVGFSETHPYTIARAHRRPGEDNKSCGGSLELVVRKHAGFSRRLHRFASAGDAGTKELTAFVMGPYGHPPASEHYETVVLVAASTGASYTMSMLEDIVASSGKSCVTRVEFLLMAKTAKEIAFYVERLYDVAAWVERADAGLELSVQIAVTGDEATVTSRSFFGEGGERPRSSSSVDDNPEKGIEFPAGMRLLTTRPDLQGFIRDPIEAAGGESLVVVCGGSALVATVRNFVACVSDERAVHKGTGAQGICLHAEQYGF
ncbi:metalloreductase transmembrane [Colletotrichum musicola]|uniref:ferric-chelate reductase (NADPH) n=1 Tax=Colletotrichum musicola TaxID=2175873 RepID=A0A8H6IZG3_9PEZI|nr:metalloreductase transmembrane [Colletotrichum musicola]